MIKYPMQIISIKQEKNGVKKTLGIDARLSAPDLSRETEKSMPLEMHNGFSRFVVTLIQKEGDTRLYPRANIPANDAYYVIEKTKEAMAALVSPTSSNSHGRTQVKSPAYTERFQMGSLKGKTPAQVLLTMSDGTNQLVEQGKFLAANVAKYPANQKLIDAIKDAIHLQHEGLLSNEEADSSSSGTEILIYDNPMKPLRSQQLDNGDCLVYGIRIVCDLTRKLPFSITVSNSYAPIKVTEKGTLNPQMSKAHDKVSVSMNFSEKDWFAVINRMERTLINFESTSFESMLKAANQASYENAQNAAK